MKQNTDAEMFKNKSPFNVPENYFFDLKNDIQLKTENLNSGIELKNFFNINAGFSALVCVSILLIIFNYFISSQKKSFIMSSNEIYTQFENSELLNIDEEFLFEFVPEDDYVFSDEIEYLIDNNADYNLIIE
jgi:hypothetical protein